MSLCGEILRLKAGYHADAVRYEKDGEYDQYRSMERIVEDLQEALDKSDPGQKGEEAVRCTHSI